MSTYNDTVPGYCNTCGQYMPDADTCLTEDTRPLYGLEDRWAICDVIPVDRCRDCNVTLNARHHDGCCIAECEHGYQALTCPTCGPIDMATYFNQDDDD